MCYKTILLLIMMAVVSTVFAGSSKSLRSNTAINKRNYDPNDPMVKKAAHEDTPFLVKIQMPASTSPEIANANPNTVNMLAPENRCNVCKKFFANIVFPKLIGGRPACQPKDIKLFGSHGDGPTFKGYCQLWTATVHGNKRGSLKLTIKDMVAQDGNLGTDPSCTEALAFDACVDMAQCKETPCEVCQDKVTTAATLALNSEYKGLSPVMKHFETMCNDVKNPEILKERKKIIQAAKDNEVFLKKYQNGYNLFATKCKYNSGRHDCTAGAYCRSSDGVCKTKLNDYSQCSTAVESKSGRCWLSWGTTRKCAPTTGFADRSSCVVNTACRSGSCVVTAGTDKHCKPTGGWNKGERCSSSSHCAGTRKCDGFSCQETVCDNCYGSCYVAWVWCSNCLVCGGHHHCNCRTGGCPFVAGRILSNYDSTRCWDWKVRL